MNDAVANLSSVVTESNFPYANMAFIHVKLNRVVAILELVFPEINLKRYTITFIYFYAYIINMYIFVRPVFVQPVFVQTPSWCLDIFPRFSKKNYNI